MKNFLPRALSGIVYASVIFLGTTIHPYGLIGLMMIFCGFSIYEFIQLTKLKDRLYQLMLIIAAPALFFYIGKDFLDVFINSTHYYFYLNSISLVGPVLFILAFYTIFKSTNELLNPFAKATVGIIYTIFPFVLALTFPSFAYELGEKSMHYEVFFIFVLLWASDSFAYIAGNLFGKHKMAPSISGGKTWEGFAGGLIFTIITGILIHYFAKQNLHGNWIIIGLIVAVLGPIGDLTESKLKRFFGVKDSGNLIPGHGGFLDRLDSFIFVVPFIYLYYLLDYTL